MDKTTFEGYMNYINTSETISNIKDIFYDWDTLMDFNSWDYMEQQSQYIYDFDSKQTYQYLRASLQKYTGRNAQEFINELDRLANKYESFNQLADGVESYYFKKYEADKFKSEQSLADDMILPF